MDGLEQLFFLNSNSNNSIYQSMKTDNYGGRLLSEFRSPLWILVFILSTMISCTDEEVTDPDSPGYHITESEKLVIPLEVDLPTSENTRVATYYATGVQIYNARQKPDSPGVYEWVFVSPSATLYNDNNEQVGTHFAGPSWQLESGDRINGQQFTPAKAKSMSSNSVDWLLLMPKDGSIPTGIFKDVIFIQRIATTGGKAPTTLPTSAGETIGVEYTAVYRFSKAN
jgi:hypothetical protein